MKITKKRFCEIINFSNEQLDRIASFCKHNKGYHPFTIPKKNGGEREIFAPSKPIKILQRKIKNYLADKYHVHKCCHSFIKGKSIITNSSNHIRHKWCLSLDLSNFFPTINFGRVLGLFKSKTLNFDNALATTLAIICCHDNQLPQGAPTSPILANMICYSMDRQLYKLTKECKCNYTRYADDMTISTHLSKFPNSIASINENVIELSHELKHIIESSGFIINSRKTRLRNNKQCQMVTGIVVNEKLNLKRCYYRNLRTILYNCKKEGLLKTSQKNGFENENKLLNYLNGRISYYGSVVGKNHTSYNNICKQYNKYIKYKYKNCNYSIDELGKSLFVIESESDDNISQGTAFSVDNKLYTCKHCIIDVNQSNNLTNEQINQIEENTYVYYANAPMTKYKIKNVKLFKDCDIASFEIVDYQPKINFRFSQNIANPLDECICMGYPGYAPGATATIKNVTIESHHNYIAKLHYIIDENISHGMSGGPLINKENEVIGIITNGGQQQANGNRCIAISNILDKL